LQEYRIKWNQEMAPPLGCTHYIILDGVKKDDIQKTKDNTITNGTIEQEDKKKAKMKRDPSIALELQNRLTEAFAKTLPNIAFQALNHHSGFKDGLFQTSNYVTSGMPLLLLDCRTLNDKFGIQVDVRPPPPLSLPPLPP
jgi:hypothetical protein